MRKLFVSGACSVSKLLGSIFSWELPMSGSKIWNWAAWARPAWTTPWCRDAGPV
jgi:hypothetical protein